MEEKAILNAYARRLIRDRRNNVTIARAKDISKPNVLPSEVENISHMFQKAVQKVNKKVGTRAEGTKADKKGDTKEGTRVEGTRAVKVMAEKAASEEEKRLGEKVAKAKSWTLKRGEANPHHGCPRIHGMETLAWPAWAMGMPNSPAGKCRGL